MLEKELVLLHVIEKNLREAGKTKKELAERLGMRPSTLSNQFARLKRGGSIPIQTLFAVEELTEIKIFNI